MAVKILTTNGTPTTGTWYRAEASKLSAQLNNGAYNDDLGTERTIPVTFANAGNQQGLLLYVCHYYRLYTGTLTIKLQEYTGGAWTDRTTDTFTIDLGTSTDITDYAGPCYFPLTTYAVTTASSTWRYSIQASDSSRLELWRTTSAGDYFYGAFLDADTTAPTSGSDTVVIGNDITFTLDQNFSFVMADSYTSLVCCMSSKFEWENAPASSYTMTLGGPILVGTGSEFEIGTEANPIPVSEKAIIDVTACAVMFVYPQRDPVNNVGEMEFNFWGEENDNIIARLASNASSGQADIVTTTDMSSIWSNGDTVMIYGQATGYDTTEYTIQSITGTTITLTGNLSKPAYKGGAVVCKNERDGLGIEVQGRSSGTGFGGVVATSRSTSYVCKQLNFVGVYCNLFYYIGYWGIDESTGINLTQTFRSIFFYAESALAPMSIGTNSNAGSNKTYNTTIENVVRYRAGFDYVANLIKIGYGFNCTLKDIVLGNNDNIQIYIDGSDFSLSGVVLTSCSATLSDRPGFSANADGVTIDDCYFSSYASGGSQAPIKINGSAVKVTNSEIQSTSAYGVYLEGGADIEFKDCNICDEVTSDYYDIYAGSGGFINAIFKSCGIGSKGVGNSENMTAGSYIRFNEYDATSDDHRGYYPYGYHQSTGDGLTDTTVHTSGTGKFAIRIQPTSSTNNLDWEFSVPTGDIQNKTMTVAIWCKVNSATYYGGTHQMPRLTIDYDDGTTAYAQAGQSTDWQLLFVTFTPTTSFGQLTVTLSGKTDASGSDAYVYFDDMAVLYPAGYKLDLGGLDLWADGLPIAPPIATVLSAKDVWTASSAEDYGTNTLGNKLRGLNNPTILLGNIIS